MKWLVNGHSGEEPWSWCTWLSMVLIISAFRLGERNKLKRRADRLGGHFLVIAKNRVYSLLSCCKIALILLN